MIITRHIFIVIILTITYIIITSLKENNKKKKLLSELNIDKPYQWHLSKMNSLLDPIEKLEYLQLKFDQAKMLENRINKSKLFEICADLASGMRASKHYDINKSEQIDVIFKESIDRI